MRKFTVILMACSLWLIPCTLCYAGLAVSVTGTPTVDWAVGTIGMGVSSETTGDKWTATNEGSVAETIYIKADGTNWSPGEAAGANTFILKHDASGSWSDAVTNTDNGIKLANLAAAGTKAFDLHFTAPASTTVGEEHTLTITLTAAQLSLEINEVLEADADLIYIGTATGYLVWPRCDGAGCLATFEGGTKQWKDENTIGEPTWSSVTDTYDYTGGSCVTNCEKANYPAFAWAEDLVWPTAGYTDWRLPTKDELSQLYTYGCTYITYTSSEYWSSTEYGSPGTAWWINFLNGGANISSMTTNHYVRAVRDRD